MICLLVTAVGASANPIPMPPGTGFSDSTSSLSYIFLVNLPWDTLLLSVTILAACRILGSRVGRLIDKSELFIALIVSASVLVAVAGTLIDFSLLFTEYSGEYVYYSGSYWYDFTPASGALAGALVGLSVYAVCLLLVRMDKVAALIPAILIGVANYVSWYVLTLNESILRDVEAASTVIFLGFLAVPTPLVLLASWNRRRVAA